MIEAKRDGVHSFCITIDTQARDYLPHLYDAVNWAMVDDVKKLPLKVSDIYRRLTSELFSGSEVLSFLGSTIQPISAQLSYPEENLKYEEQYNYLRDAPDYKVIHH